MNYKSNLLKHRESYSKLIKIDNVDEFLKCNKTKSTKNSYNNKFSTGIQDLDTQDIINHFLSIKSILNEYGFMNNFEVSDLFDCIKCSLVSIEEFDETSDDENTFSNSDDSFLDNIIYDECFYF